MVIAYMKRLRLLLRAAAIFVVVLKSSDVWAPPGGGACNTPSVNRAIVAVMDVSNTVNRNCNDMPTCNASTSSSISANNNVSAGAKKYFCICAVSGWNHPGPINEEWAASSAIPSSGSSICQNVNGGAGNSTTAIKNDGNGGDAYSTTCNADSGGDTYTCYKAGAAYAKQLVTWTAAASGNYSFSFQIHGVRCVYTATTTCTPGCTAADYTSCNDSTPFFAPPVIPPTMIYRREIR